MKSEVQYYPFLPRLRELPETRVHATPKDPLADVSLSGKGADVSSVFLRSGLLFASARDGLAVLAKNALGLKPNDRVLMPAYHCRSMVEPFEWAGLQIEFYRVTSDLRGDYEDFVDKMNGGAEAAVIVDYFGFEQDNRAILQVAVRNGVPVLRDCAHRLFLPELGPEFAGAVSSLWKFIPSVDGGLVVAKQGTRLPAPTMPGFVREVSGVWSLFDNIARRLRKQKYAASVDSELKNPEWIADDVPVGATKNEFRYFQPDRHGTSALTTTKVQRKLYDCERVSTKRRRNYLAIEQVVQELKGVSLLFDTLPDTTVPYVVPVLLDHPMQQHACLRQLGIGALRWEDLAVTECPVSADYRHRLVQLPCHQGLSEGDMAAIAKALSHLPLACA